MKREYYMALFEYAVRLKNKNLTEKEAKILFEEKIDDLKIEIAISKRLNIFRKVWDKNIPYFERSELGNGERFVYRHGKDLRFCYEKKKWFIWDGKRWVEDRQSKILEKAKETVRSIRYEAIEMQPGDRRDRLMSHALSSETVSKLNAMLKAAPIGAEITVSPEKLDTNKWLLNCLNGTLDLKTGKLQKHNSDDLITKIVPAEFDPNVISSKWLNFLNTATNGEQEMMDFLQRIVGYSLTGDTGEKCLFFLFGTTDTGKTTFIETIRELMGDYAKATDFNTFLYKKYSSNIRNDIAMLEGARYVSASEAAGGHKFDEPLIKQITGRDKVVARFLYKEFTEFKPEFKIFLASNHLPKITGMDEAFYNRFVMIPFDVRIPAGKQDKNLDSKLRDELTGILSWAVEGCLEFQRIGLKPPESSMEALNDYRLEGDVVEKFIKERCRRFGFSPFSDLFNEWESWCRENKVNVGSNKSFSQNLTKKGFMRGRKIINGKQVRIRHGIITKSGARKQFEETENG